MTHAGKRVGIVDIAKAVGVSKASVSYALNGTGRLDPETRDRILKAAGDLGYKANFSARNLRRKGTGVVIVGLSIAPTSTRSSQDMRYFMAAWQGALDVALERGYLMLFAPSQVFAQRLDHIPCDGAIVMDARTPDPLVGKFLKAGIPVVTIGQDTTLEANPKLGLVDSPHGEIAQKALDLMSARGARQVALIQGSSAYHFNRLVREAYEAFCSRTDQAPQIVDVGYVASETAGHDAMHALLSRDDPPDAVFAGLDRLATGALLAVERAGLKVPDDVMIAAGSDGLTERSSIPITSSELYPDQLGRSAMDMLIRHIETGDEMGRIIIPGALNERASTAASLKETVK